MLLIFLLLAVVWLYFCVQLLYTRRRKIVQRSPPMRSQALLQRLEKVRGWMDKPLVAGEGRKGNSKQFKIDGEAIAFARLYALARQNSSSLSLPAFCEQVCNYLPNMRSMLLTLSQRISLEGSQRAFEWFEKQFPERHMFIHQLCVFLQTADQLPDPVAYIDQSSQMLDKISRDHYERRRKAIAPFVNILNTIPAALVFFMVLLLILKYMAITRSQITY